MDNYLSLQPCILVSDDGLSRPKHVARLTKILLKVFLHLSVIYKGKAIQLQAWRGPEFSSSMRFPDFKTIGT